MAAVHVKDSQVISYQRNEVETTGRDSHSPIRMSSKQKPWYYQLSYLAVGNAEWYSHFGKKFEFPINLHFKKILNLYLKYGPAVPFVGIYMRMRGCVHTKTGV